MLGLLAFILWCQGNLGQRETVKFDFAWKFHLGDPPGESPNCGFPIKRNNVQCHHLHWTPIGRKNATDCELNCCSLPSCLTWQWKEACWQGYKGDNVTCNTKSEGWVGGSRTIVPPEPTFKYSDPSFPDSEWEAVDIPHDFVIYGKFSERNDWLHGYLPRRKPGWYRKHFRIPPQWLQQGKPGVGVSVHIQFEGVFQLADMWLNGKKVAHHIEGYTPFTVQLDKKLLNTNTDNVLVVRADASFGSGHWYEGGGIYRHVSLVKTGDVHFSFNGGVFSRALGSSMYPQFTVINEEPYNQTAECFTQVYVLDNDDVIKAQASTAPMVIRGRNGTFGLQQNVVPQNIQTWSVTTPYLYTLYSILQCRPPGSSTYYVADDVNTTVGFRSFEWTPDAFTLNGQHVHLRGFAHHNDFAGIGTEVRERVYLYQGQAARWSGSNSWRMSHNPYNPQLYDILDGLGVLVWDENRDYIPTHYLDMGVLVRRDRNHPCVVIWSLCNEVECTQDSNDNTTQYLFRDQIETYDPKDRPISANFNGGSSGKIGKILQVQGFSHRPTKTFEEFHKQHPNEGVVASECCSCEAQRAENSKNTSHGIYHPVWNGNCIRKDVGKALSPATPFVSGSLGVWTLFDYIGEARPGWPLVSCSYGQFDLAGFTKTGAYWYNSWWLCAINTTDDRPPLPNCHHTSLKIAESWNTENPPSTIHVYSDAPLVELMYNSKSLGSQGVALDGYATFTLTTNQLPTVGSTLTAHAKDQTGTVTGTEQVVAAGIPYALNLTTDAPSPITGTGSAVVLDGQDVALVGVRVVDKGGHVVEYASNMIQFTVISGPARIVGVGNGDAKCHEPNKATKRSAYHGLARVIVQSNEMSIGTNTYRSLLRYIDVDSGSVTKISKNVVKPEPIVVRATSPGLLSATIEIPTSVNEDDLPLNLVRRQYPKIQRQHLQFP